MRAFNPYQIAHAVWNLIGLSSRTVNVTQVDGVALDTHDAGSMPSDVRSWNGATVATPTVAGVPGVDVTHVKGISATIGGDGRLGVNIQQVNGVGVLALIAGRMDVNAQVVGDKTGYSLTAGSYSTRASSTQRATILVSGVASATASVAAVTTTRAVVHFLGCTSTTANVLNDRMHSRIDLTNATTVTATKGTSTDDSTAGFDLPEYF